MLKKRSLSQEVLDAKLVVIQGNAKDEDAVRKVLVSENGRLVDQIASGIGGAPRFTPLPTIDDPLVCRETIATVVAALGRFSRASGDTAARMPLMIAISTTGLSQNRDIPLAMVPLYHWMLAVPHADKRIMEERIVEAKKGNLIRDYVIVRPSLLLDGQSKEVRVGWEGKAPGALGEGAAIGYSITREDVGRFIFDNVIAKDGGELCGKKVSITH
ncbi:MAG: hypothetical protein Q9174_001069 [Haloplaca sp. 1 TL-2023]